MAIQYTTNQAAPYPNAAEYLKDVNDHIRFLATWADGRVVMRFSDMTDLGTKVPSPTEGQVAWINGDNTLLVYDGSVWQRVYPHAPMVYTGTAVPSSGLGATGDLYVQYV